jgi:hypothetical protein
MEEERVLQRQEHTRSESRFKCNTKEPPRMKLRGTQRHLAVCTLTRDGCWPCLTRTGPDCNSSMHMRGGINSKPFPIADV